MSWTSTAAAQPGLHQKIRGAKAMTPGPAIRATPATPATPMDPRVTKSGLIRTLAMAGGLTRRKAPTATATATVGGRKTRAPRAMIGGQACH